MNEKGFSDADKATIRTCWQKHVSCVHSATTIMMDLFGNVPFVTEDDLPGAGFPEQIQRADLFDYIEDELLAIEGELIDARAK